MGPTLLLKGNQCPAAPISEVPLDMVPETEVDPEFEWIEEVRYPRAEQAVTLGPDNLNLMVGEPEDHLRGSGGVCGCTWAGDK